MLLVFLNRQQGTYKSKIVKCSNFLNAFQLSEDENADFIKLNNKLSTVKEIIKEINQLKQSYHDLPEQGDLNDALEITMDLEEEAQHLDQSENPAQ
ncbi:hypothetical protein TNIN_203731 [Trichonephila inaurata madagascariensis]|uniref:Uncharacterized protein n=1 Tax=Trichonephila inaurata madagascariensis TaxID=2747483 RepID=A0A8X6XIQ8_9ARAC|nr:hypothetical protein TNIN_203731 [Trichonephila inaurata madagascariensis]